MFQLLPLTHEQHLLVLLPTCLIKHIYIPWQLPRQTSLREGRICHIHLPLPSPGCWFSSFTARGRHFLFLVGVLTPLLALSGALGWGTALFTAQGALCAESQHSMAGWAREQPAAHSLSHTHKGRNAHRNTLTKSRDSPRGLAEMFTAAQSLYTVTLRDKQQETSINPATITCQ